MQHQEYIKTLERELRRINKEIDAKIIRGQEYYREARDHRILMRKIRQHARKSFFNTFVPSIFQF